MVLDSLVSFAHCRMMRNFSPSWVLGLLEVVDHQDITTTGTETVKEKREMIGISVLSRPRDSYFIQQKLVAFNRKVSKPKMSGSTEFLRIYLKHIIFF